MNSAGAPAASTSVAEYFSVWYWARRAELCALRVRDCEERRAIRHLRVYGKRDKIRYVPVHPRAMALIENYLDAAGHRTNAEGPMFRPIENPYLQSEKPLWPVWPG